MTRFATFARAGDFWVFGDDQAGHLVRVLYEDQFFEIKQTDPEVADFGKFVWLSTLLPDTAVVAVSSAMTVPASGEAIHKVEFYLVERTVSQSSIAQKIEAVKYTESITLEDKTAL